MLSWWEHNPGFGLLIPLTDQLAVELHRILPQMMAKEFHRDGHVIPGISPVSRIERALHDILLAAVSEKLTYEEQPTTNTELCSGCPYRHWKAPIQEANQT